MNKIKKILIFLISLFIITGCFAKFYLMKTPEYSLYKISTAVEESDVKTFQKHVDLKNILSGALEDIIAINEGNIGIPMKDFLNNSVFFQKLKLYIIEAAEDDILNRIEGNPRRKLTDRQYAAAKLLNENINAALKVEGYSVVSKQNSIAFVDVEVRDSELDFDFVFKFKMKEMNDGMWRVVEVINFKEYILERENFICNY